MMAWMDGQGLINGGVAACCIQESGLLLERRKATYLSSRERLRRTGIFGEGGALVLDMSENDDRSMIGGVGSVIIVAV